jgi:AcrR family transcriptional regulator
MNQQPSDVNDQLFPSEPEATRTAIMKATFDALSKHGYSNLTIKRIDEEFLKSEALIYHHYESKDELLLDLLSYLLECFEEREIPTPAGADPETQLRTLFDHILSSTAGGTNADLEKVLIELRAQAVQDETYRAHFTRTRTQFQDNLSEIIQNGIDSGVFREVDAEQVAEFLTTIVSGVMFDRVTTDEMMSLRAEIDHYIESRLLADTETEQSQ